MVRTKRGFFYKEFVDNGYVALGFNILDKNKLNAIKTDEDRKSLKEELDYKYGNKKNQGTQIFNKCVRFINEIKPGDIIMIPSSGSEEVAFALAGEYFEVSELDYKKEIEIINQIEVDKDKEMVIMCPYKKRRKITIIKKVNGKRLNPNLYKALASIHGISSLEDYAEHILSSIYSIYHWNNKISLVFNVEKESAINALALSSFIYNSASLINNIVEDNNLFVSAKANLNSPGDIVLILQNLATTSVDILSNHKLFVAIIMIWIGIFGGKFGPIEFKSVVELVLKWKTDNSKLESDKLERDLKNIQIEKERLALEKLLNENAEKIQEASSLIEINRQDVNNVIDIASYLPKKGE